MTPTISRPLTARLPPEILCEILERCISVSPEALFSAERRFWGYHRGCSPAHRTLQRCSHLLLVCRQWHTIGTHFLYASLWITRATDAEAIAGVLHANPALRGTVRAMRVGAVEDGFGDELQYIVEHTPNLRTVRLEMNTSDWAALNSLDALGRALPRLNVTTLWLSRNIALSGRNECRIADIVHTCLAEYYVNLKHLHLDTNFNLTEGTAHAIRQCPSLEIFSVALNDLQHQWSPWLLNVLNSPNLQIIRCRVQNPAVLKVDEVKQDLLTHGVRREVVEKLVFSSR